MEQLEVRGIICDHPLCIVELPAARAVSALQFFIIYSEMYKQYNICQFTLSVCCYSWILYGVRRISCVLIGVRRASCVLLACGYDTFSKRLRRRREIVQNLTYFPENYQGIGVTQV